jgi:hypothetical protein
MRSLRNSPRAATRAARFASRAAAIASRHGANAAASTREASRAAARPRSPNRGCAANRPRASRPLVRGVFPTAGAAKPFLGALSANGPTHVSSCAASSGARNARRKSAASASRFRRSMIRMRRSSAPTAPAAYRPCVVFTAANRRNPASVRAPVLAPPCIRHRPFAIAGARHAHPVRRAFAPQRGARLGAPRRLPLRNGPDCVAAAGRVTAIGSECMEVPVSQNDSQYN